MDTKRKASLLCAVIVTFVFYSQSVFSVDIQTKDFLMVDVKHSVKDNTFSVVSVDQVAATLEDVALRQSGQYKVSIFNSELGSDISSNYFTLSQDNPSVNPLDSVLPEIATSPSEHNNANIDQEIILALPLVLSAKVSDLVIKIEDTSSGKILLEKQLANTTFQVRSVSQFNVNTPLPQPPPIPDDLFSQENVFSKYRWHIGAGIALIVLIGLAVILLHNRKTIV